MPEVRGGGREELPCIRGKEQQLCFAGAAVKRDPASKVRETQVKMVGVATGYEKANTLKP